MLINEKTWKVPKTFPDYIERFPNYHKAWLWKRYPSFSNPDFDDVAQFLLLETIRKKRVEKFKPGKGLINKPGLFFSWMSRCFNRDLATLLRRRQFEKRRANYGTMSFSSIVNKHGEAMSPEAIMLSDSYQHLCEREGELLYIQARIAEFRAFVEKHRPDITPDLNDYLNGREDRVANRVLMPKLGVLAKHFEEGSIPDKKRRYKRGEKAS